MSDSVRAGCSRVLEATAMNDFDGKMQALNDAVQNHFNVAAQGNCVLPSMGGRLPATAALQTLSPQRYVCCAHGMCVGASRDLSGPLCSHVLLYSFARQVFRGCCSHAKATSAQAARAGALVKV